MGTGDLLSASAGSGRSQSDNGKIKGVALDVSISRDPQPTMNVRTLEGSMLKVKSQPDAHGRALQEPQVSSNPIESSDIEAVIEIGATGWSVSQHSIGSGEHYALPAVAESYRPESGTVEVYHGKEFPGQANAAAQAPHLVQSPVSTRIASEEPSTRSSQPQPSLQKPTFPGPDHVLPAHISPFQYAIAHYPEGSSIDSFKLNLQSPTDSLTTSEDGELSSSATLSIASSRNKQLFPLTSPAGEGGGKLPTYLREMTLEERISLVMLHIVLVRCAVLAATNNYDLLRRLTSIKALPTAQRLVHNVLNRVSTKSEDYSSTKMTVMSLLGLCWYWIGRAEAELRDYSHEESFHEEYDMDSAEVGLKGKKSDLDTAINAFEQADRLGVQDEKEPTFSYKAGSDVHSWLDRLRKEKERHLATTSISRQLEKELDRHRESPEGAELDERESAGLTSANSEAENIFTHNDFASEERAYINALPQKVRMMMEAVRARSKSARQRKLAEDWLQGRSSDARCHC